MKKCLMAILGLAFTQITALAEPISSGPIVPGEWNSNYRAAYEYAVANHMPFIAIVSKYPEQCHFCSMFHDKWTCDEFLEWAKARGPIMGAFYTNSPDGTDSKWVDWVAGKAGSAGSISGFPMIRVYWDKGNGNIVWDRFMGRQSSIGDADGDKTSGTVKDFIARLERTLDGWNAVTYNGGEVDIGGDVEGDRLEADAGTAQIELKLVRDEKAAQEKSKNTLSVTYPSKSGGLQLSAINAGAGDTEIEWAVGDTNKTVNLAIDTARLNDGDAITLVLKDENGEGHATNHVWFVEKPVSAVNPYWIGEKADLGFGEWTMDLDAATNLVAKSHGQANTLVLLEGALWCGDCKNVEANFLSVTNSVGENRFEAWAKANNIALVAIDTPSYTNDTDYARPTLLSREDVRGNGVSGRGYLTRKMISDADAAKTLERNRKLCKDNTDKGGFHRPEDGNKYRTGVPFFVMLRKDGSVAARLTRWASVSSTVLDKGNIEAFYNRFDEMLAMAAESGEHVDADEIENGYPGAGATAFTANGGSAEGELSHADMRDVFRLSGVGGNALQKVTVKGGSDARVKVSFVTTNELGKVVTVGEPVTGKLSDKVVLEYTFTEAGDYFVLVEGESVTAAEWAIENKNASNFVKYQITGEVVLIPQERSATATAAKESVVMRLVKDEYYRILGVDAAAVAASLEADEGSSEFFTALEDGDIELAVSGGAGSKVEYQLWHPGAVGFIEAGRTVKENDGTAVIEFGRAGGVSGDIKVRVSIDDALTKHEDSDGILRYVPFEPVDVIWKDGESSTTNVVVTLLDDASFDGPGKIVLTLDVIEEVNDDVLVVHNEYVLAVQDDDKSAPGTVSFVESGTVYCKASAGATVHAIRTVATDGDVTVAVSATAGKLETETVEWAHRDATAKAVTLKGLAAGKSATLALKAGEGGVAVPYAGRTLRVVAVPDNGPEFDKAEAALDGLVRNVAMSYLAEVDTQTFESGSRLIFTKKSGTLPAGLTAKWNGDSALQISGVPTKAGEYIAVYQVSAANGGKTVAGLTTTLKFSIKDAAAASADGSPALNPAIAATRNFKDVMIVDGGVLKGLLNVQVPANGRANAKFTGVDGSVSLLAKSWSAINAETGALTATLAGKPDWSLELTANADGSVALSLNKGEKTVGKALLSGVAWSAKNPASNYTGYYTVSLPVQSMEAESVDLAPKGAGYLTLDLTGRTSIANGTVKWAGLRPNGTAISGSTTLTAGDAIASLPIFKVSGKDSVTGVLEIRENAVKLRDESAFYKVVESSGGIEWSHVEPVGTEASFTANLVAAGCLFDRKDNLEACCNEFFNGTTNMWLAVEGASDASIVAVSSNRMTVLKTDNALSASLVLHNPRTGVASGRLTVNGVKMSWQGVVLVGLGGCSACSAGGDGEANYPLVNGTAFYTEKIPYEVKLPSGRNATKTATVYRSSKLKLDVEKQFE